MSKVADIEKAYALIIGISEYKDPGIRRLNYTHADAEGIFKLLTDPKNLGLSKDNIKILLDKDATLFNIKDAISNWLYKNADKDSVVFIFFAGHGGVEEVPPGIEKDNLAKFLLPFDSVLDNLFASALSNRDFNDLLLRIRSRKLVIFMDSCYSGGVSERTRDVKITEDPYKKLGEGEGRLVIAASQPDQRSYEDSRIGHGVFTYNLLEALSGKADLDNDGYVTVLDAYKYLQDSVPRDAMKLAGGIQEPIFRGDMKKDFVISIDRERFQKIEKEEIIQKKISKLLELRNRDKLSAKKYARLREIVKTDFEKLSDNDKRIAKLLDDFFSEDIPITTFIEDLGIIESELIEMPKKEKERQEQERKDIEAREKAAKKAQLKSQEMAKRLEEERLQKQKEEEERANREREERRRIEEEKEQLKIEQKEKGSSYNKLLVVATVLGILLLVYWGMMVPGSNDSPKIPDTTPSTPAAGATASPAPITSSPDKKTIINSIGMEFVQIPAGEIDMGSPVMWVNIPRRIVELNVFYLGKYEVTQKEWLEVMGTNPSSFTGDDLPVENVSWFDVRQFIAKLNVKEGTTRYRLPSEAEWEYAARAGTTTIYSFGDDASKLGDYAWYSENSNNITHSVGQKKPNAWGMYDMHGNVWEWVQDKMHVYDSSGAPKKVWVSDFDHYIRGGAWDNDAGGCRSAVSVLFGDRSGNLGFRLLRDL